MRRQRLLFGLAALAAVVAIGCSNQSPTSPQTDLAGFGDSLSSEAKLPKVDVCHITGNGKYVFININGNALPAHLAHGDSLPGENGLDASCTAPSGFVDFISLSTSFFGEAVVVEWTVTGTADPVTYYVEGRDDYGNWGAPGEWIPIIGFGSDAHIVVGTGNGTYSVLDVGFLDAYRVLAVDGNGNEVLSPTISAF